MGGPLRKPDAINWNAAPVELPEIPMIPAGQDAMSATISAVLPTLAAELAANVAALSAKENTFSGKVGAAQVAYQNSDDAGSQSVGQIVGMLGQLGQQAGQMSQSAGAPMQALGGQTGMFGSLMQQAMQGAQGAGGQSGGGQGGATSGGAAPAPMGPAAQQPGQPPATGQPPREDASLGAEPPSEAGEPERRDEREPLQRADDSMPSGAAGPERSDSGAAPVSPPTQAREGDGDVARNL